MARLKLLVVVLLSLAVVGDALASGPRAVRRQAESSMLVTGSIDIEADGRVSGHALDRVDELPEAVVSVVANTVGHWRFEPVVIDGSAARVRVQMIVRMRARKLDDGRYRVSIRNATFNSLPPEHLPHPLRQAPPVFPFSAARAGATGTVYLVLRLRHDGTVEDVVAEQVNLTVVAPEMQMARLRDMLAGSAVRAARDWAFAPPRQGRLAGEPYWDVRVPVVYAMEDDDDRDRYGTWHTYIPGPRRPVPWLMDSAGDGVGADALVAGGVYPAGQHGPRLLTPFDDA